MKLPVETSPNLFNTPMMKQYEKIKRQYSDCILFYRMGDFYELFLEDAHIGARVLNITLTSKSNGKSGKIPMAGVPYHAVDSYLSKMVRAGYKIAICEQVSLPNKYGLVEREVVRIVTPGTVLDEKILEKKDNNYIVSLDYDEGVIGIAVADISTGYFASYEVDITTLSDTVCDELTKLSPSECILPEDLYNDPEFLKIVQTVKGLNIYPFTEWYAFSETAQKVLKKHFQVKTLASFGFDKEVVCIKSAAALIGYLQYTQKNQVSHIKKITKIDNSDYLLMDRATMINLELFSTIREHDTKGSLLYALDNTLTSMGGRLLKSWMKKPLIQKDKIEERLDAIEELLSNPHIRQSLESLLIVIPDIERILSKLSVNIGNARDCVNLKIALQSVLSLKKEISGSTAPLLKSIYKNISEDLELVIELIDKNITDEPPLELKDGGLIKTGVDEEVDRLRAIITGSRDWILMLEKKEKERSGISSLKIRYNKVFGFYIEISKANLHNIPNDYHRKQTLVNGERFVTPDLKRHEEIILTAEEKIKIKEYILYKEILEKILLRVSQIQIAAEHIGILDCILSFSKIAEKDDYVRPKLLYSGEIRVTQSRHPVVEKLLEEVQFVPNDVTLDNISQSLLLITGPNMAGKSVFIRQVALIVLMSQMGCFVPAQKAHVSIVDRIFVRSGASDVITSGLSTFMVEMVETAHILHHATKNSLIVMDEIGRGTSTYDGISIAWAVAEYLVTSFKTPPKTLFATHYHELQSLEFQYPQLIRNFHMAVADDRGTPIFLHTILPGGASHSFGVAVAKLAGIPETVIKNAESILKRLEKRSIESSSEMSLKNSSYQIQDTKLTNHLIYKELDNLDISQMTPLQALNKLAELKDRMKLIDTDETLLRND